MEGKWGWPMNSRKAHVFVGSRSLCGKWLFMGADLQDQPQGLGEEPGRDDCKVCWRKAKKAEAKEKESA